MLKRTIGENAGHILQLLNKNGEMPLAELFETSQLDESAFNFSLGWLAGAGKISIYETDGKQIAFLIFKSSCF